MDDESKRKGPSATVQSVHVEMVGETGRGQAAFGHSSFALPECQDPLLAQRCYPRAGQMQHPAFSLHQKQGYLPVCLRVYAEGCPSLSLSIFFPCPPRQHPRARHDRFLRAGMQMAAGTNTAHGNLPHFEGSRRAGGPPRCLPAEEAWGVCSNCQCSGKLAQ